MRSTTLAGPGPFGQELGATSPATFHLNDSENLVIVIVFVLARSNLSDIESISVFARSISFLLTSVF
jgi:hypothetical protein